MAEEHSDRVPHGVCGQIVPWNFPLLMAAWKIAPALAAGNTVVLKPAEWTPLTALFFGGICREAGVPPGVVNIVTGDGETGAALVRHPGVDKIAFTGSTEVGRDILLATAGTGKALTLELGGKSPFIVFEDADLDSAVEGVVDAIWFNGGQVCCAGSRLLLQEGIAGEFLDRLRLRMTRLRVGDPLDKCIDMGPLADPAHLDRVRTLLGRAGGSVFTAPCKLPAAGAFMAPTLVADLAPADPLMQEEVFGPVLAATTFRSPAEAVQIANDSRYGLAASLWTEDVSRAVALAPKLMAGVIWVNGTNLFDAAAGFGGLRESGFGREGGREGLLAYTRPADTPAPAFPVAPFAPGDDPQAPAMDRTAKNYVGGKQARPDNGLSRAVFSARGAAIGHVGIGSRKDIRNAVEAARKAQPGWDKAGGALRAQILYYLAENLSARGAEFTLRLTDQTGAAPELAAAEVAAAIERLFHWAAMADKFDGAVKPVPMAGLCAALSVPAGVIGIIAPETPALLGLIGSLAPALAAGNTTVLVPSWPFPMIAAEVIQLLETSDIPAGVANIVTGAPAELATELARHADVDAVWAFAPGLSAPVETAAAGNLKRTWTQAPFWERTETAAFRDAATQIRTIWIPAEV